MRRLPNTKKPGERKSAWNSLIVDVDCSAGPLRAMITAPV